MCEREESDHLSGIKFGVVLSTKYRRVRIYYSILKKSGNVSSFYVSILKISQIGP